MVKPAQWQNLCGKTFIPSLATYTVTLTVSNECGSVTVSEDFDIVVGSAINETWVEQTEHLSKSKYRTVHYRLAR